MKATIITMTRTYNYGATLQAYALQEYIRCMGNDCLIIDHMNPGETHRKVSIKDLSFGNLLKLPYKKRLEDGYRRFECFYRNHMNMTRPYYSESELFADPPVADVYISGSDQVWNPRDAKLNRFFLNFAPEEKKRISYAASLGVSNIPEENKKQISDYLQKIDGISLREEKAYDSIRELTDKPISVNCDPVFLLDREQWRAIQSPVDGLKPGEYILCYLIYRPEWFSEWIKQIGKKTGKKIVVVGLQGYRRIRCDRYIRDAGPSEFLWLIDNAAAVATTSFHGSAFSILFGKPLVAIPDPPRPTRIRNLLKLFGLERSELNNNDSRFEFEEYSIEKVDAIVKIEREKSENYLRDFL